MSNEFNKQPEEQEDTPFPEIRDPGAVRELMFMNPDVRQAAKRKALQHFKMGVSLMEGYFQEELKKAPQGTIPLFTLAEVVASSASTAADLLPGATQYKADSRRALRAFLVAAANASERGELNLRDPVSLTPISVEHDTWLKVMRSRPLDAEWDEREKLKSEHVWISHTENRGMVFRSPPVPWVVNIEEVSDWMKGEGIKMPAWLTLSISEALDEAKPEEPVGEQTTSDAKESGAESPSKSKPGKKPDILSGAIAKALAANQNGEPLILWKWITAKAGDWAMTYDKKEDTLSWSGKAQPVKFLAFQKRLQTGRLKTFKDT